MSDLSGEDHRRCAPPTKLSVKVQKRMSIEVVSMPKYEKVQMILGFVLGLMLLAYGTYALMFASCTVVGRGNPPMGTIVTFQGLEARLLSTIYLGSGLWLIAATVLRKINKGVGSKQLSWFGAITLLFGMLSLVVILCLPLF